MINAFQVWWHRVILRHGQQSVMNGETEPGVKCYCWFPPVMRDLYMYLVLVVPDSPLNRYRWFPSDGGGGK